MNLNKINDIGKPIVDKTTELFTLGKPMRVSYLLTAISIALMAATQSNANELTQQEKVAALMVISNSPLYTKGLTKGICVFSNTRYRGHRQCFTESISALNDKLDDQVASLTVSPEYKVTIYQDSFYGGGFETFEANAETINVNLNGTISSVAVALVSDYVGPTNQINPNDMDFDGVNDDDDFCLHTALHHVANQYGCSEAQLLGLSGGNGGNSGQTFQCIDPLTGAASNDPDCQESQIDSDFDGVVDGLDPYPLQSDTQCFP